MKHFYAFSKLLLKIFWASLWFSSNLPVFMIFSFPHLDETSFFVLFTFGIFLHPVVYYN